MYFTKFIVFLCIVTSNGILEGAEASTTPTANHLQDLKAASEVINNRCGPFGVFNCFDGRCSCFLVFAYKTDYNLASKHCQHYQGQLITLAGQNKNDFIATILEMSNIPVAWIMTDTRTNSDKFRCLAGQGKNINCVQFSSEKDWVPSDCTETKASFVCEVPYGSTDLATNCSSGWARFGNHCYQLQKDRIAWEDAKQRCKSLGSNLVSIHSQEENVFMVELMTMLSFPICWTGFRKNLETKAYYWDDGTVDDFTQWAAGQPDNYGGYEECAEVRMSFQGWNDLPCNYLNHYMCKTELKPKTP